MGELAELLTNETSEKQKFANTPALTTATGWENDETRRIRTMNYSKASSAGMSNEIASRVSVVGFRMLRYGLVLVIGWIGMMKFTGYEANGIQPLVAHSPFMSWMYHMVSVRQFSCGLGVVEVGVAILIALRAFSPRACALGSATAALMFITTLSFLFTTPGWEPTLGGFPALSAQTGQFLLKDLVLLGAALWSFGESLADVSVVAQTEPARKQDVESDLKSMLGQNQLRPDS